GGLRRPPVRTPAGTDRVVGPPAGRVGSPGGSLRASSKDLDGLFRVRPVCSAGRDTARRQRPAIAPPRPGKTRAPPTPPRSPEGQPVGIALLAARDHPSVPPRAKSPAAADAPPALRSRQRRARRAPDPRPRGVGRRGGGPAAGRPASAVRGRSAPGAARRTVR